MRFVRIPFFYIPTKQVHQMYRRAYFLLKVIDDIHNERPNRFWAAKGVKEYVYYPEFLRWIFRKAKHELITRGMNAKVELDESVLKLRSRPLNHFIPPTTQEIAEDVVWLLDRWKTFYSPGGKKLPYSYVELAERLYGYTPQQAALERVDEVSGRHRDSDSGWYFVENQT